jgi:NodT family efflux transporter outer membrane factor (OMF) lipoprotein
MVSRKEHSIFCEKMNAKIISMRFIIGLIACAVVMGGCAVGPDYIKPSAFEPQQWLEQEDARITSKAEDYSQWWTVFNDPVLNTLIEKAYQQNLTLRIAGIRIMEARAELGIAFGNQFPQLQQLRGGYSYSSASENAANTMAADLSYSDVNVGFDAAWELDFWGKFRRAVQSNVASLDASIANYDDFLVALTAEVARAYVQIRTLEQRLFIARENVTVQKRSLRIARVRFEAGEVTELDVMQAITLLKNTEASIPRLEAGLRQSKNALCILLGTTPSDLQDVLGVGVGIPTAPAEVAVGVPAELLRRRPDIRLAELQVAAQSPLVGVAKADLYPHFALFGSIGLRSSDGKSTRSGGLDGSSLSDLFEGDSVEFFGGPSVSWDIFNYGRIKNRVRVQDARLQELVVNYQNTVLRAAQEVEDSLVGFLRSQEEEALLSESVKAAKRSVEIAMIQYREGIESYQRVLDTQRAQAEQEDILADTSGSVVLNLIAIYKALGGGWEIREGKSFVPEKTREEMEKRTNWGDLLETEK